MQRAPITFDQLPSGKVEISKGLQARPTIDRKTMIAIAAAAAAGILIAYRLSQ
jgi:hypothetical protein